MNERFERAKKELEISNEEIALIEENRNYKMYSSQFQFLEDQNCWRPAHVHLLLGQIGLGKTTLLKSLLLEAGMKGIVTLIYLSEEGAAIIKEDIKRSYLALELKGMLPPGSHNPLDYLFFISEISPSFRDLIQEQQHVLAILRKYCLDLDAKLLFFDNLTTCDFYNSLDEQVKFAKELKKLALDLNIPVVLCAHATKGFTNLKLMSSDDVRGSNQLAQQAEQMYCFNCRIVSNSNREDERRVILSIAKHRKVKRKNFLYALQYDYETDTYLKAVPVNMETARGYLQLGKQHAADDACRKDLFLSKQEIENIDRKKELSRKQELDFLEAQL